MCVKGRSSRADGTYRVQRGEEKQLQAGPFETEARGTEESG